MKEAEVETGMNINFQRYQYIDETKNFAFARIDKRLTCGVWKFLIIAMPENDLYLKHG